MNPIYKILLGLAVFFALTIALLWYISDQQDKSFKAGRDSCVAMQATAQVEHTKTVKAGYDKIDKQTPTAGDDAAIADFLLRHTRSTGK